MAKKNKEEMTLAEFNAKERTNVGEIFNFNSNIQLSLYADSIGVKVPESCYRGVYLSQNTFSSEHYLLNSKRSSIDIAMPIGVLLYSNYRAMGSFSFRNLKEEEESKIEDNIIPLPEYEQVKTSLDSAIRSRRSIRNMSGKPISLKELSTVLYYATGVSGEFNLGPQEGEFPSTVTLGDKYTSQVRNAPSGGGLYPVTLFLVIQNVKGLENGIYSYMPITHSLKKIKLLNDEETVKMHKCVEWGMNIDSNKINVMFFYVYNILENSRKYNDMGLLFGLIEAGEISQNVHLVSTALNLAPCDIGGYHKVLCEKQLGVDGLSKHVVHLTILGTM
ncbi:SagB family peptide dehydrogenase [Spirochaetota bacterium]